MFTAPPFVLGCVVGALAFANQPLTWEDLSDPTEQYSVVMSAHPGVVATVLFGYGIASSVIGEIVASVALRGESWTMFEIIFGLIAGIVTRASVLLDCIALVIVWKAAPQLALIGSPAWIAGLGLGLIIIPIRTTVALVRKDHFEIISMSLSGSKAAPATSLAAPPSPRRQQYRLSESMTRAVTSPQNHLGIRRICHAAIVFDWSFLSSVIVKEFASIPLQTDLLLMSSMKAYFLTLGHQLLVLPVKVFFAYDVAPNIFILASVATTVVSFILSCGRNAVPLHKDSIDELIDSAPAEP